MTGTTVTRHQIDGTANTLSNSVLEQLIHNNVTPDRDGMIRVTGLPQPGPGQSYRFHMIGAGEGQAFDPVPKNAEILPF